MCNPTIQTQYSKQYQGTYNTIQYNTIGFIFILKLLNGMPLGCTLKSVYIPKLFLVQVIKNIS